MSKARNRRNRKTFLLKQQAWKCAYCHSPLGMKSATLDHVVPKCMGGPGTRDNQVAACLRCNGAKGNKSAHVLVAMLMQGLVA